jgi:hypothetical protein
MRQGFRLDGDHAAIVHSGSNFGRWLPRDNGERIKTGFVFGCFEVVSKARKKQFLPWLRFALNLDAKFALTHNSCC